MTNDVGGVRDYGAGEIFPVVPGKDSSKMADLVRSYLDDCEWRNVISADCRQFAASTLSWPLIRERHKKIYSELII